MPSPYRKKVFDPTGGSYTTLSEKPMMDETFNTPSNPTPSSPLERAQRALTGLDIPSAFGNAYRGAGSAIREAFTHRDLPSQGIGSALGFAPDLSAPSFSSSDLPAATDSSLGPDQYRLQSAYSPDFMGPRSSTVGTAKFGREPYSPDEFGPALSGLSQYSSNLDPIMGRLAAQSSLRTPSWRAASEDEQRQGILGYQTGGMHDRALADAFGQRLNAQLAGDQQRFGETEQSIQRMHPAYQMEQEMAARRGAYPSQANANAQLQSAREAQRGHLGAARIQAGTAAHEQWSKGRDQIVDAIKGAKDKNTVAALMQYLQIHLDKEPSETDYYDYSQGQ